MPEQKLKIGILTRSDNSSPRILAETLARQLEAEGVTAEVFYDIGILTRLVASKESGLSFQFWLRNRITHFLPDQKLIARLKEFDAVVVCECTPNGFRRKRYNVEKLKSILQKPILYYEVYYLGNAPTQIELLKNDGDALGERYDIHLSASPVTEIRGPENDQWYCIGLYAQSWGLQPVVKNELLAIVDFLQPGYEQYRELQIRALDRAGIKYISLERRYSISEIRGIYQQASLFFVQFPEAFGLPILECLCSGAQIFTAQSGWPMAFRLDKEPAIHGPGMLPECFTIYDDEDDLVKKLEGFKQGFDKEKTAQKTFDHFIHTYPGYYYGDAPRLRMMLEKLRK